MRGVAEDGERVGHVAAHALADHEHDGERDGALQALLATQVLLHGVGRRRKAVAVPVLGGAAVRAEDRRRAGLRTEGDLVNVYSVG